MSSVKKRGTALAKRPGFLPALCYGAALVGWFVWSLFCLGSDMAAARTGRLQQTEMQAAAFELHDLELQPDGSYLTTGGDPQMVIPDLQGRIVRNIAVRTTYTKEPYEMCLYYTTRPGESFSQDKRVFAVQQDDGSCIYYLPRARVVSLRYDPCSPAEIAPLYMTVDSIVFNTPQSPLQYFAPGWTGAFKLILWPGMAAVLIHILCRLVQQAKQLLKKR